MVDDVSGGPHLFRRLLPHRTTYNVVAEAGDPDAERTIVFVAHHDAAHGGAGVRPAADDGARRRVPGAGTSARRPRRQVMLLVAAGPALVALGALTGLGRVRRLGTFVSLASAAAFADIASRSVVPGANDNLSGVAVLLELARVLRERPVKGVRVLLVSTGSEESFMEGMRGFARRHFPSLPPERTEVVCLDSVGSPELILIEGEGMLRMRDYTPELRDRIAAVAAPRGRPPAPPAAARARHRRADRAQGRLPERRDRLGDEVQAPAQLPLASATRPTPSSTRRSATRPCCARRWCGESAA